jgi:hypothetical protein
MVFNATVNTISVISWQSVVLVEETGVSGEKQQNSKITTQDTTELQDNNTGYNRTPR